MSPQQKIDYFESQIASWLKYPGPGMTAEMVRASPEYLDRMAELKELYREQDEFYARNPHLEPC